MIEDHPMIGKKVDFDDGKRKCCGTVTGVKYGGILTDTKTMNIKGKAIKLRIKPDDGSRAFWTMGMAEQSA